MVNGTVNRRAIARPAVNALLIAGALVSTPVLAAELTFSGRLVVIEQAAGGVFAGADGTETFSGWFRVGDADSGAIISVDPVEGLTDYFFQGAPFGGRLGDGRESVEGAGAEVGIENDVVFNADEAALVNAVVGETVLSGGAALDLWSVEFLTAGASIGDDPGTGEDVLTDGLSVEFLMLSIDNTLYDDTAYRALPSGPGQDRYYAFVVREGDAEGNLVFEAYGLVDDFELVPARASVPLPRWVPVALATVLGGFGIRASRAECCSLPAPHG